MSKRYLVGANMRGRINYIMPDGKTWTPDPEFAQDFHPESAKRDSESLSIGAPWTCWPIPLEVARLLAQHGESTSPRIARLAAIGMHDPNKLNDAEIRSICASALTQALGSDGAERSELKASWDGAAEPTDASDAAPAEG